MRDADISSYFPLLIVEEGGQFRRKGWRVCNQSQRLFVEQGSQLAVLDKIVGLHELGHHDLEKFLSRFALEAGNLRQSLWQGCEAFCLVGGRCLMGVAR